MPDSKFPWPGSWWTNTGRRDGADWVIPGGATFVPWANTAVPVGSKLWTVEFTYTAAADVPVAIRHNPFSKADERSQVGQLALRTATLPKGERVTRRVNLSLTKSDQPLWTPSFLVHGSTEVRFHAIKAYETSMVPEAPTIPAGGLLPVLGAWWRGAGQRRGDGAYINAGASTTPYDGSAISVGSRRFTFEMAYTSGDTNIVHLMVNWFSEDNKKQAGPFSLKRVDLSAGAGTVVKIEVELPADARPKWLPSLRVDSAGHDILISSLKVYETPRVSPRVMVWDGEVAQECTIAVWDGTAERAANIDIVS